MPTTSVATPARARWAGVLALACSLAGVPNAFGQAKLVSSWYEPANGECRNPRVSADGRRVVFVSKATNLEPLSTTGLEHVYLWDARGALPRVLLVSQSTAGLRANGPSENPSISPDGNYVAFNSTATNLGAPATGGWSNVYVHAILDPDGAAGPLEETRTTTWVSRTSSGQAPAAHCGRPSMSGVGLVAFECLAANMVPGDTNDSSDVFVATVAGTDLERVSTTSGNSQATGGYSWWPSISADGQLVAFMSYATNLVPIDSNNTNDVFVKDRRDGRVRRMNSSNNTQPLGSSYEPAISADGRFVAFASDATNMVPGLGTERIIRIYRVDLDPSAADTHRLVSTREFGGVRAGINADGSKVAYELDNQTYLWDQGTSDPALNVQVSTTTAGASANGPGRHPALAPNKDETYVVWSSTASDLGSASNGQWQIFERAVGRAVAAVSRLTVPAASSRESIDIRGRNVGIDSLEWIVLWRLRILLGGLRDTRLSAAVLPTVSVGGVAALAVSSPEPDRLRVTVPVLAANSSNRVVLTYADGEVLTLPRPLRAVALVPTSTADGDADGLPDWWELTYGLDPGAANAPAQDTDGDGSTDAQEYAAGHHPTNSATRYLAEGATGALFLTRVALANPGVHPAEALLRFTKRDGSLVTHRVPVGARSRATVDVEAVAGMADAEFSTAVESDEALIVDRTMRWTPAGRHGSHAERSVPAPATTWYLAEGATHSGFDLFYLLQNANPSPAEVRVRYLLPSGANLEKTYAVPANSRANIWVDYEQFPDGSGHLALADTDVSAVIDVLNGMPIIVERAMYLTRPGELYAAGHESAGVTAPAVTWSLAEGATGPYFDLFVLVANPNAQDAAITATYLLEGGAPVTRTYTVGANSRFNIWVDYEGGPLGDAAVSTKIDVTNDVPVIVERAMWWPTGPATWGEAHNSAGSTETGTRWGLAEGEVGGPDATETYILIANTSPYAGQAVVTLLFEDATSVAQTLPLAPNSRTNVPVREIFGAAARDRRFGAIVESVPVGADPAAQIAVERAMYSSPGGRHWAAGTNALATRLP